MRELNLADRARHLGEIILGRFDELAGELAVSATCAVAARCARSSWWCRERRTLTRRDQAGGGALPPTGRRRPHLRHLRQRGPAAAPLVIGDDLLDEGSVCWRVRCARCSAPIAAAPARLDSAEKLCPARRFHRRVDWVPGVALAGGWPCWCTVPCPVDASPGPVPATARADPREPVGAPGGRPAGHLGPLPASISLVPVGMDRSLPVPTPVGPDSSYPFELACFPLERSFMSSSFADLGVPARWSPASQSRASTAPSDPGGHHSRRPRWA